jgi:acylphosphatase
MRDFEKFLMTVRRRVTVRGRVQGVFFRDSCRREAAAGKVAGWARNALDGSVEAVFEGEEAAVARLIDWCRIGPPRAEVTAVEVIDEPPIGEAGFRVR